MVSIAILSADQRLAFQIHQWMKDIAETATWQVHADPAQFVTKMETESSTDVVAASQPGGEEIVEVSDISSEKSKNLDDAYIRLVIVDLELLQSRGIDAVEWTRSLKQVMRDRQRSDPAFPTQFLFMAFEGGGFKVDKLLSPVIDDLILKPLDRSVFLQKIEIATSDDPAIKPSYLFRQRTNLPVEIGKESYVDEISESAMAMRNPFPLSAGVFASIHASVMGEGDLSRVICRSYKSEPHPAFPGQSLVRFGFFGLRAKQQANVKKFVRERQAPPKHRQPPPPNASNDPTIPFNRVAVIDMNVDIFNEIQSTIKDHYIGVSVSHYLSYARLLATFRKLFPPDPKEVAAAEAAHAAAEAAAQAAAAAAPVPTADAGDIKTADQQDVSLAALVNPQADEEEVPAPPAWTTKGDLIFTITAKDFELLKFDTSLASGDTVFGRTRLEWLERPRDFMTTLDRPDLGELREMVDYAVSGSKGRGFLKIKNQDGHAFYVQANSVLTRAADGDVDAQVQLQFKEATQDDYFAHARLADDEQLKINPEDLKFDAIYVDVNLIRGDFQVWYDGLHEAFMRAGVLRPGEPMPKIILLAEEKSKATPDNFRLKIVSDFMYKPLDRKILSFKARELIDLVPRTDADIVTFVKCDITIRVAKDAVMEEISEFGLSISHNSRFKKGATVRFFSPLFGGGAEGVIGKCSYCEERKVEKKVDFLCHFIFFGTPEEILKRIRSWIRENYIHSKEGGA